MKIGMSNLKRSCEKIGERGWLILETAVSIPIISMLFVATCLIFWQGWKFYRAEVADWILQEEICQAMQNMSQQISQVAPNSEIKIQSGKHFDRIEFEISQIRFSNKARYEHDSRTVTFFVDSNTDGENQLYSRASNEPITGANVIFGKVAITKFRCKLKRTDLLRIELGGISFRTNHEFELATEIFLPNMKHE